MPKTLLRMNYEGAMRRRARKCVLVWRTLLHCQTDRPSLSRLNK